MSDRVKEWKADAHKLWCGIPQFVQQPIRRILKSCWQWFQCYCCSLLLLTDCCWTATTLPQPVRWKCCMWTWNPFPLLPFLIPQRGIHPVSRCAKPPSWDTVLSLDNPHCKQSQWHGDPCLCVTKESFFLFLVLFYSVKESFFSLLAL